MDFLEWFNSDEGIDFFINAKREYEESGQSEYEAYNNAKEDAYFYFRDEVEGR